ncbi:MAG: MATE family efflux transporter [Ruminococcaceae bacterium]|nr:MATE family efflux transporter [Oscillospiraceae bacterium]
MKKNSEKTARGGQENKMGVMPIPRLLFSMSLPIIISMLVQALYNIVDSIFVAMYNPVAGTAALTIAFPIQNLMIAVAVGLAVGMNALLSRALGEKDFDRANKIAGQGFFLTLCGYLLFLLVGIFLIPLYVSTQSGSDPLIRQYGVEYLSVICIGCIGIFIEITCERLLQSTGKTVLSMVTQMTGAIINIILDPILIFGLGMGIYGAAVATVIGQLVSGALGIFFNIFFNKEIKLRLIAILPRARLLKDILIIGIPSVLMQAIGSLMTYCMNMVLGSFENIGVSAMNVFGIYFKLQSFIFMPIFGLNNGMVPIIAYNYGAKRRERVMKTIRLAAVCAISYMLLGLAMFQIFPAQLLSIFNANAEMLEIGTVALRTISLSFIFAGFCIVTSSVCQALGKSIYSLFTSVGRQLLVLIPASFLLSLAGNVDLVWFAFPIAEIVSVILSVVFMLRVLKKLLPRSMEAPPSANAT